MDNKDEQGSQVQQSERKIAIPRLARPKPRSLSATESTADSPSVFTGLSLIGASNSAFTRSSPIKRSVSSGYMSSFSSIEGEEISDEDARSFASEEDGHAAKRASVDFKPISRQIMQVQTNQVRPNVTTIQETSSFTEDLEAALDSNTISPAAAPQKSPDLLSFNFSALQSEQDLSRPSSAGSDRSQ